MAVQTIALIVFHLDTSGHVQVNTQGTMRLGDFVVTKNSSRIRDDLHEQTVHNVASQQDLEASLAYVRSFRSFERPLIFFHIPKTAGTAIEYAAGKQKLAWGSCLFHHKPKRDICQYPTETEWPWHVGWWHLPTQLFPLANMNPYQAADLFGVIRDPYDRAVSEFYYICTLKVFAWRPDQCDRTRLLDRDYMNQWIRDKIKQQQEDNNNDPALQYLSDNGHFTPQYQFIFGPHNVRMVDHVLQLDGETRLSVQFSRLMDAYSLPDVQLEKRNALGAQARGNSNDQHSLTVRDLDQETIDLIHQSYPHDFDLGYAKKQ